MGKDSPAPTEFNVLKVTTTKKKLTKLLTVIRRSQSQRVLSCSRENHLDVKVP